MRVRILLEKKIIMLEINCEILKIKKSMSTNIEEHREIEQEMKTIEEGKLLIEKLIKSITWENLIDENNLKTIG
ncbi:MAG: hypothetical protein ACRCZ9_08560 [Fusobacteriaceae bacterium]